MGIYEQFLHFIAYPLITANVVPFDRDNIIILFLCFRFSVLAMLPAVTCL